MKWKFAILGKKIKEKKKKERKQWAIIHIFIHMQHIIFVNPKCASGVNYSNFSSMVKNALLLLQDLASKFRAKWKTLTTRTWLWWEGKQVMKRKSSEDVSVKYLNPGLHIKGQLLSALRSCSAGVV